MKLNTVLLLWKQRCKLFKPVHSVKMLNTTLQHNCPQPPALCRPRRDRTGLPLYSFTSRCSKNCLRSTAQVGSGEREASHDSYTKGRRRHRTDNEGNHSQGPPRPRPLFHRLARLCPPPALSLPEPPHRHHRRRDVLDQFEYGGLAASDGEISGTFSYSPGNRRAIHGPFECLPRPAR